MTEVQLPNTSTWKEGRSPMSYWNSPQAVKTTKPLGDSMRGYGTPVIDPTPAIEQMYDITAAKQLPGKGPKGNGQFVDWGTKLYQLELEISYKNNEIVLLQKKLKKCTDELYPGGNTTKKSIVTSLQNQNEISQKKLETKGRQLKWEQNRNKGLQKDLADVKKQNLELRRRHLVNEKAVQTMPDKNKDTQISSELKKSKTRTAMTQCTPTVFKVTNSTRVTRPGTAEEKSTLTHRRVYRMLSNNSSSPSNPTSGSSYSSITNVKTKLSPRFANKNVTIENKVNVEMVPEAPRYATSTAGQHSSALKSAVKMVPYAPPKQGVKFATSMTIKENPEKTNKKTDPLEMSITQEFGKQNTVKTVVHSNRDFEIREKPVMLAVSGQPVSGTEHISHPVCTKSRVQSTDIDSGLSSIGSDSVSPPHFVRTSPMDLHSPRSGRVSYRQILDGASPTAEDSESASGRVYERNMQEYMQPAYPITPPSSAFCNHTSTQNARHFSAHAWDVYNRDAPNAPSGMVPYYMFRRTNENAERNRNAEKPIFVHVSEITMNR